MNYAGIGSTIGHEMSLSFDENNRFIDKHGNSKDWWDPETTKIYQEKAECIRQQYSNYALKKYNVTVSYRKNKIYVPIELKNLTCRCTVIQL